MPATEATRRQLELPPTLAQRIVRAPPEKIRCPHPLPGGLHRQFPDSARERTFRVVYLVFRDEGYSAS